jgi:hypothetical protein
MFQTPTYDRVSRDPVTMESCSSPTKRASSDPESRDKVKRVKTDMDDPESVLVQIGSDLLKSKQWSRCMEDVADAKSLDEKKDVIEFFTLAFFKIAKKTPLANQLSFDMNAVKRLTEAQVEESFEKLMLQQWQWILNIGKCLLSPTPSNFNNDSKNNSKHLERPASRRY